MNTNRVNYSNAILFLIAATAAMLVIPPSGLAQSNKPPEKLDALAAAGDPAYGEEIYHRVACAECHGENGQGSDGPPLLKLKITFPDFVHWVRNASNGMDPQPPAVVSDAELADIYAFIGASPKAANSQPASPSKTKSESSADSDKPAKEEAATEGGNSKDDLENGKKLFSNKGCDKCHGPDGQGGAAMAKISPLPDSVEGLIAYVRKPTGKMPASAANVISDKELGDIFAFLKAQPKP